MPLIRSPPDSVIVKGALRFPDEVGVKDTVPAIVPFPMFVKVAVPLKVAPVAPMLPVAFVTVNVVLIVAANAGNDKNRQSVLKPIVGPIRRMYCFTDFLLINVCGDSTAGPQWTRQACKFLRAFSLHRDNAD